MIIFKKIRYRNFLSSGNHFIEFDLSDHKTNLIIGTNGSGKCVNINTIVRLKNKKTGEITELTVGEFYEAQKKQDN